MPTTLYRASFKVTPMERRPFAPAINPVSTTRPHWISSPAILVMVACFSPDRRDSVAREQIPSCRRRFRIEARFDPLAAFLVDTSWLVALIHDFTPPTHSVSPRPASAMRLQLSLDGRLSPPGQARICRCGNSAAVSALRSTQWTPKGPLPKDRFPENVHVPRGEIPSSFPGGAL